MTVPRKRLQQILKQEKENRKRFAEAVLTVLLLARSLPRFTIPIVTARLATAVQAVQTRAQALATKHAGSTAPEPSSREEALETLSREAAAASLAAVLVRGVQVRLIAAEPQPVETIAHQVAREASKRVSLTADTEFYREYNAVYLDAVKLSSPGSELVWEAVLDKHTCPQCDALDGTRAPVAEGFKTPPPLHPRCRCIVSVV